MHASKRITIIALSLWLLSCLVGAIFTQATVIYAARRDLSALGKIISVADDTVGAGRILVVGSSPAEMGISAREIEQETGKPSFNFAVGNSAEFFEDYLRQIEPHIREGDVVVISSPAWLDVTRPSLVLGCVNEIRFECIVWKVSALPHLSTPARFLPDALWSAGVARHRNGDIGALDLSLANKAVDPLPPTEIVAADLKKMSGLITRLRARGACPLLAIGPVLVGGKQQASWVSELGSLQNAAYKIGLGRYILSDDVAQVERAQFLDSYEHPSPKGGTEWTRRIINRLKDREMNPCAAVMAGE